AVAVTIVNLPHPATLCSARTGVGWQRATGADEAWCVNSVTGNWCISRIPRSGGSTSAQRGHRGQKRQAVRDGYLNVARIRRPSTCSTPSVVEGVHGWL